MKSITKFYMVLLMLAIGNICTAQEPAKAKVKTDIARTFNVKKDTVKVLKEVGITSRKQIIQRKGDRLIFNVDGNSAAAGNPLLEVMRQVPGLSVTNDKLNIRGKEGLIIMIDNRRTYMTGDELLSYLKNTPAETISQLEVITNPSARYDAEGNAGIINIKTKKGSAIGTTGTVSQTLGYGSFLKSTTGGQVTYTDNKLTLFGNAYFSSNKYFENYYTENSGAGYNKTLNNNYGESHNKGSYSYQAGFDYHLNKHSTFGGVSDGSLIPNYWSIGLSTLEKTGTDPAYILTHTNSKTNNTSTSNNLHYSWNDDKNMNIFSAEANYVRYNFDLRSTQTSDFYTDRSYTTFEDDEQLRNRSIRSVDVFAAKADYTHKWNEKHTMESGIKWSSVQTNSDLVYEELQENEWINDPGRTNQYNFKEQIYAGYLNYNGQFGTFNFQTGLRAEQTINTGFSATLNSENKRKYLKLFPSLFLSQTFLKDHSWSVSYSYRVDRPTYSFLNPFTFINNPYSYFRGNPNLKPQYTHNFEGSYDFKKKFFLTLGYSHTTDRITEIAERANQSEIVGGTRVNLSSMDSYNVTVNMPFQPVKGWDINIYAGGFRNLINDGAGFSNGKTTFTTTLTTSVSLPVGLTADVNGDYQSAMSYGTILIKPMYGVNGGVKKSFLSNKLNLRVNVSDIFNQRRMIFNSLYGGIEQYGYNTSESRVVRVTASYKFGKFKAPKLNNSGAEEEQRRARF